MNAPLDPIHAESVHAIRVIRHQVDEAKARAASWMPAPPPASVDPGYHFVLHRDGTLVQVVPTVPIERPNRPWFRSLW